MARLARVVAAGIPHHITQRGNARRFILDCDSDRKVYIDLLKENIERTKVSLLGYLPDVQSRTPGGGSCNGGRAGAGPQAYPRPLCLVLECASWLQWSRMAGQVLLLSDG